MIKIPRLLNINQLNWIRKNIDKYPNNEELARYFNITIKQLKDFLFTHKIRRSYTNQKRIMFNENFFEEYNALSCYWAGFIAADGCISKRKNSNDKFLTINLQIKDKIHLENFINHLNSKNLKISERKSSALYNGKQYIYCSVILYSNKIVDDLKNNFNIYERKTLNLTFPIKLPFYFYNDYIRGYIDGDGCLSVFKDKNILSFCLSFVGNLSFIKKLAAIINEKYSLFNIKNNLYNIKYNSYNSIRVFQKLYLPLSTFCLERKRNKYFDYMNNITNIQKNRMLNKGIITKI